MADHTDQVLLPGRYRPSEFVSAQRLARIADRIILARTFNEILEVADTLSACAAELRDYVHTWRPDLSR